MPPQQTIIPDVIVAKSNSPIFIALTPIYFLLFALGISIFVVRFGAQNLAKDPLVSIFILFIAIVLGVSLALAGILLLRAPLRTKFETATGKVTTYGLTGKHQLLLGEVVGQKRVVVYATEGRPYGSSALRLWNAKGNTVYIAYDNYKQPAREQVRVYLDQKWPEIGKVQL